MTRDKARKRETRARMAKTGERYSAARSHVVEAHDPPVHDPGVSDASIRRATGRGFRDWLRILDEWGAKDRKHGEIATYLMEEHGVPGWWAQTVTVGWERARGVRQKYQTASGFQVSVSKTLPVEVGALYRAFTDARRRNRWLERGTLKVRTKTENKTARFDFRDEGSRVHAYFEAKGPEKTTVTIQHEKLSGPEDVEEKRAFWKERLQRLVESV